VCNRSPNYSGLKKIGAYSSHEMEVLKEALIAGLAAEDLCKALGFSLKVSRILDQLQASCIISRQEEKVMSKRPSQKLHPNISAYTSLTRTMSHGYSR